MFTQCITRRTSRVAAIFLMLVGLGSAAAAQQAEKTSAPNIQEIYLAKDDGNGKAGEEVTAFATTDIPIHCVVLLDMAAKVTVKMNFVAVAVAGVKADTKVVTASYTTTEKQNRVNFTGRPEGRWTPGRYRVEIFLDGRPGKNIDLVINSAQSSPAAGSTTFVPPKRQTRK